MARKKSEVVETPKLPETPAPETPFASFSGRVTEEPDQTPLPGMPATQEKVTKMEGVRRALADGIDKPSDIVAYMQKRFGLEINEQTVSSYKSGIKAKEREGGAVTSSAPRRTTPSMVNVFAGPSLQDLLKVKKLLATKDAPETFLKHLAEVQEMADQVGGLASLKELLQALVELKGA